MARSKEKQEQDMPAEMGEVEGVSVPPHSVAAAEAVEDIRKYHRHMTTHIIVDSCGDFAPKVAEGLQVEVIGFPYVLDGEERVDDLWQSLDSHDFYEAMRNGARASTSAVSPGRYLEVFERAAERGMPTLYLGLTRGLSSSIENAQRAAEMVRESHPDFELYVLDNLCPSAAAELLVIECVRLAGNGLTARELYEWAKDARYFVQGYFTLDSLDTLAAGGRIPPAAANVGGKLDVKPELSYDLNGSLTLRGVCRGRKKALRALISEFRDNYCHDASLPVAIVSADAEKDADWLENAVRKEQGCSDLIVIRSSVSPVIGSHVGPGMVALVFWGTDRRERISLTDRIARMVRTKSSQD